MAEILSYNPYRDMHDDVQFSAMFFGKNIQNIPLFNSTQTIEAKRLCYSFEYFTFTGKERDSETGFSYFGARYYDSDLMTGWLSVDPMADKYPNISPYAYCAWNPVRVIDPNGLDTVNIQYNSSEGRWICNEPIISEGSDVFNVTDASGNTSQTIFDNGDYGNRMNILLLEDNSVLDESFGVYHLSGTSEVGFVLQRSAKSEYHHNGEGTYSTYVGKGKHWFNYVGLSGNGATSGIRLHYGKDVSFSEGCILLAYSYTSNNCGKKFNLENSRQAISNFFTYAGALSKRENVLMSMKAENTTRRKDLYNFGHNDSNFRNPSVIIKK